MNGRNRTIKTERVTRRKKFGDIQNCKRSVANAQYSTNDMGGKTVLLCCCCCGDGDGDGDISRKQNRLRSRSIRIETPGSRRVEERLKMRGGSKEGKCGGEEGQSWQIHNIQVTSSIPSLNATEMRSPTPLLQPLRLVRSLLGAESSSRN
jgi:hypothetical protein